MASVKRIDGTLSARSGDLIKVLLDVTLAAPLQGQGRVEDEALESVELVSPRVADGDYVLEYFFYEWHRVNGKVKNGRFEAR